jgi:hypothetical protein
MDNHESSGEDEEIDLYVDYNRKKEEKKEVFRPEKPERPNDAYNQKEKYNQKVSSF